MSDLLLDTELCSPRKIRRLEIYSQASKATSTPIGNHDRLRSSQNSQESRATSTPTKDGKNNVPSISASLSSIMALSDAETQRSDIHDDASSGIRSAFGELSLGEISSAYSDPNEPVHTDLLYAPNPRLFKGKLWNFFKPKNERTLYFKILSDFDSIQECVFDLLNEFENDKNGGTKSMIKFFVDLCGYQSAEIEGYCNFDSDFNVSSQKIIKLLEFELVDTELLENKTYIFNESEKGKSKLGATLAAAVKSFLETFLVGAFGKKFLFSEIFHKYIFNFIFHMCQSTLRNIRHTGIVLVRNILSVLNSIYPRILENLELEKNSESDNDDFSAEKEKHYMERYLQYLFRIFAKNSYIPDTQLSFLKAENLKEISIWIVEQPELYFDKCFVLILKLMLDESALVRLSALEVCENLIKHRSILSYVTACIKNMANMVSNRLKDGNIKVVVKAVDIFSLLLNRYRHIVRDQDVLQITMLLWGNSYLYAKSAGSFLSKLFESAYPNDEDRILHKLVELSIMPKFNKLKPLFVEGFLECETVLQKYEIMLKSLLACTDEEKTEYAQDLMELIYYSVHQKLKGESVMKRKHSIQVAITSSDHEGVARIFLLNLKHLFESYKNEIAVLNYLIKVLSIIDYDVLTPSYHGHYIFMMKNCMHFFLNENNDELMENICNLFNYLCYEKNLSLKENLQKRFLHDLFENISKYLMEYFEEEQPAIDLDLHFKRIGKLYEKFNLNKYFDWAALFTNWGNRLLCEGQVTACMHFIIWSIRDLLQDCRKENLNSLRIRSLYSIFKEYTKSLLNIIESQDNENDMRYMAFEALCFLYNSSDKMLLQEQELGLFRNDILEILKKDYCKRLEQFFKNCIVHEVALPIKKRKNYISKWLNMMFNAMVDILYIIPLFKCYHSHSQEYGNLIEFASDKIFSKNPEAFFNLILATIHQLADDLFRIQDKSLSQARELLALSSKFANMKELQHSSEELFRMLHLGIGLVFQEEFFEFLVLLQSFIPRLSEHHRKLCLQLFVTMTPKEYENHRYVRAFNIILKSGKPSGQGKADMTKNLISSLVSTSEDDITENIAPKSKKKKQSSKPGERSERKGHKISVGSKSQEKKSSSLLEPSDEENNEVAEKVKGTKKSEYKQKISKVKTKKPKQVK